ncbi:MAG: Ldh family oxidoreductase, partial [Spirochaetales bacterium]|nr:Ldh family oxidoreductase [Spirochaetales bacterium]
MAYEDAYRDCAWVDFTVLENFMRDVLMAYGVPRGDAEIAACVILESDRRGIDSHGICRFKPHYLNRFDEGVMNPVTRIDVLRDEAACVVLDGNNGLGHVVGRRAMEMAIDRAKKYGLGMAVARNSTHYGIAGYYVGLAINAGMIGVSGTNARPSIAPTFGVETIMGTNPLTWGIPTDEEFPFILDCATSIAQRGKIEAYGRAGKDLPSGWVIGEDGLPLTDTVRVLDALTRGRASLTPLGGIGEETAGYKGYGYAAVVEILCAALQDGKFLKDLSGRDGKGNLRPYSLGHFFIAINPQMFMGLDAFRRVAGDICRGLRASRKAPGRDRIYTPGEKEFLAWQYRRQHGCPIP